MSEALVKIMNLPCTGFDNDGEETVSREAAAAIAQELEARLAEMKSAYENLYHHAHHGASVAYDESGDKDELSRAKQRGRDAAKGER